MPLNLARQFLLLCLFLVYTVGLAQDSTFKKNLGPNINGRYTDIKPLISPDGKTLYFARQGTPENVGGKDDPQDVYISELIDGVWTKAVNIGQPINNEGPNGVSSVSPDGNTLLLINQYDKRKGISGVGFSVSEKVSGGWGFPTISSIKYLRLKKSDYIDFFLANNGQVLLNSVIKQ